MREYWKTYWQIPLSLPRIMSRVIAWTFLRVLLEAVFLDYPMRMSPFLEYSRLFLENISYFIILFLLLCLAVSALVRRPLVDTANFGIRIYPLMVLPPLLDVFVFSTTEGYNYGSVAHYGMNLLTLGFMSGEAGWGISLEILVALLIICGYIWALTRSVTRVLAGWACGALIIITLSTPDLFMHGRADFFFIDFLPVYYYLPLLVLSAAVFYRQNRKAFFAVLGNLRPLRGFIFVLATFLGARAAVYFGYPFAPVEAVLIGTAVFFAWEFSVAVNDLYDLSIDEVSNPGRPLVQGTLSLQEGRDLAAFYAYITVACGAIINAGSFCFILVWLFLGLIYSVPPVRLRQNPGGNLMIGLSLVLSFLAGLAAMGAVREAVQPEVQVFCLVIGLWGTVISLTKDFKDVKGDGPAGVRNILTIFGVKTGRWIVYGLVLLALNTPLAIYRSTVMRAGTLIFSVIALVVFIRTRSIRLIYFLTAIMGLGIFITLFSE